MSVQRYAEAVYAGVLGKLIGVYLGRPVEGWPYDRIEREFGELNYYVNSTLDLPLVVADDDISGTFGFFRVVEDNGYSRAITPKDVGDTWLNYIIEDKTILWWGGLGRCARPQSGPGLGVPRLRLSRQREPDPTLRADQHVPQHAGSSG